MGQAEATSFIQRVCQYYEHKPPTPTTLTEWISEIEWIPVDALLTIYQRMKGLDGFPKNLPARTKAIYYTLKSKDGVWSQAKGCPECDHGILNMVKDGHTYAFRCGSCLSESRDGIPVGRMSDLLSLGYAPHWTMGTIKQIKSMPHYGMGREALPRMLRETIDRVGLTQIAGDWDNQF